MGINNSKQLESINSACVNKYKNNLSMTDDGLTIAVGYNDNNGRVKFSKFIDNKWQRYCDDIICPEKHFNFGIHVKLSNDGKTIGITSQYFTQIDSNIKTCIHVYKYINDNWLISKTFTNYDFEYYDVSVFGYSFDFNRCGNMLVILSVIFVNKKHGYKTVAKLFQYNGVWRIHNAIKPINLRFCYSKKIYGSSVSISGDGSHIACSVRNTDNTIILVYEYNSKADRWENKFKINHDYVNKSISSHIVSLNNDGNILSTEYICDYKNKESSHIFIYDYDGTTYNKIQHNVSNDSCNIENGLSSVLSSDGKIIAVCKKYTDNVKVWKKENNIWNELSNIYGMNNINETMTHCDDNTSITIKKHNQKEIMFVKTDGKWVLNSNRPMISISDINTIMLSREL